MHPEPRLLATTDQCRRLSPRHDGPVSPTKQKPLWLCCECAGMRLDRCQEDRPPRFRPSPSSLHRQLPHVLWAETVAGVESEPRRRTGVPREVPIVLVLRSVIRERCSVGANTIGRGRAKRSSCLSLLLPVDGRAARRGGRRPPCG